ncbi:MAG: hypothetical protein ABSB76_41770 [Streptosporangiaceae bacterium]
MATAMRTGRRPGSGDSRSHRTSASPTAAYRGAVLRSPLSLAERTDFQQLDAGRRDPLTRRLAGHKAGHIGGAQALMPRDQHRGRPGHVIDRDHARPREFGAQDRVEIVHRPAHPCVDVELAQGERSLAGPLPGELDPDRPQQGQPHAPPAALTGLGSDAHH